MSETIISAMPFVVTCADSCFRCIHDGCQYRGCVGHLCDKCEIKIEPETPAYRED